MAEMKRDWRVMGVVNATPDSFSDGGRFADPAAAIEHALKLAEEGADILDVGGESTRPGADEVSEGEEAARILPVIEGLAPVICVPISVDTRRPSVARQAMAAGASIWNDVTALAGAPDSLETAAALGCDVVLMHARGVGADMDMAPAYRDVVEEVRDFLAGRIRACEEAGIPAKRLTIDPGLGFGKTAAHNLALIAGLGRLAGLGPPVLLGASRKRFIAAIDRDGPADGRLGGSVAGVLAGYARGARLFRVHDVAATRQALAVFTAVEAARARK